MKVAIWSPNYAPELTGIPPLVTDAAAWLADRGHEVDVVTAVPNYPERRIHREYGGVVWRSEWRGDVRVHRSWLRVRARETFVDKALYEVTFAVASLPHAIRYLRRADVVVCVIPSLLAALAATVLVGTARRRPRLVLWVQDLVLRAAMSLEGVGGRAAAALHAARGVEAASVRRADAVVVCSPGFAEYFVRAGVAPDGITTIYNWVDTNWVRAEPPPASNGPTRFLYAGNLGYTQDFDSLFVAAARLGRDIEIEIVGAGNAAEYVRERAAAIPNVAVRAPVPRDEYPSLLASADAHLVLQRRVAAGANFPSKIAAYLASGRPIVAAIAPGIPAADALRESGAALVVPPESPNQLGAAMSRLHQEPELRADFGGRARRYAVARFERNSALERFEEILRG